MTAGCTAQTCDTLHTRVRVTAGVQPLSTLWHTIVLYMTGSVACPHHGCAIGCLQCCVHHYNLQLSSLIHASYFELLYTTALKMLTKFKTVITGVPNIHYIFIIFSILEHSSHVAIDERPDIFLIRKLPSSCHIAMETQIKMLGEITSSCLLQSGQCVVVGRFCPRSLSILYGFRATQTLSVYRHRTRPISNKDYSSREKFTL